MFLNESSVIPSLLCILLARYSFLERVFVSG
jgi:hypothetical protein